MKKLLNRHFPKKFKIKIENYCRDKYKILYGSYRILPNYQTLPHCFSLFSGASAKVVRNPRLEKYDKALEVAKSFSSIEDIEEYIEGQEREYARLSEWAEKEHSKDVPCYLKQVL